MLMWLFILRKIADLQPSVSLKSKLLCGYFFGILTISKECLFCWTLTNAYFFCIFGKNCFQKVTSHSITYDQLLYQRKFSDDFVSCSFIQHLFLPAFFKHFSLHKAICIPLPIFASPYIESNYCCIMKNIMRFPTVLNNCRWLVLIVLLQFEGYPCQKKVSFKGRFISLLKLLPYFTGLKVFHPLRYL